MQKQILTLSDSEDESDQLKNRFKSQETEGIFDFSSPTQKTPPISKKSASTVYLDPFAHLSFNTKEKNQKTSRRSPSLKSKKEKDKTLLDIAESTETDPFVTKDDEKRFEEFLNEESPSHLKKKAQGSPTSKWLSKMIEKIRYLYRLGAKKPGLFSFTKSFRFFLVVALTVILQAGWYMTLTSTLIAQTQSPYPLFLVANLASAGICFYYLKNPSASNAVDTNQKKKKHRTNFMQSLDRNGWIALTVHRLLSLGSLLCYIECVKRVPLSATVFICFSRALVELSFQFSSMTQHQQAVFVPLFFLVHAFILQEGQGRDMWLGFFLFMFSTACNLLAQHCKTTFFQYFSTTELIVLERMFIVKVMDAILFTGVAFGIDGPAMFFSPNFLEKSSLLLVVFDFSMSLFSTRKYVKETWIGYLNLISVAITWAMATIVFDHFLHPFALCVSICIIWLWWQFQNQGKEDMITNMNTMIKSTTQRDFVVFQSWVNREARS